MKIVFVTAVAMLLAACVKHVPAISPSKGQSTDPYLIEITWSDADPCKIASFEEEKEAKCGLFKKGVCLGRGDHIKWVSNNPSNAKYMIYFDPIRGAPLTSGGNGEIPRVIDGAAPLARYKYSIVRDNCLPNLENTYDPHIRIDH